MSARWRSPRVWLGVVSAGIVVLFVTWDSKRISPGPISAVHAQQGALGDDSCDACHGGWASSMRSACASCHAAIEEQIDAQRGFHGRLGGPASDCGRCHAEHHGREVQLADARAFALAGFADRNAYRHEGLEFDLVGKHASLGCASCHDNADIDLLPRGARRFVGLEQRCSACHDDPHAGRLADCASCHGQDEPFERVARFEHTRAFPLEASHAGHGCDACHESGSEHSIEASRTRAGAGLVRDCAACHESPHDASFVRAVADASGSRPDSACALCHPASVPSFAEPHASIAPAQHALAGFALEVPHARAGCEQCHSPSALELASEPKPSFTALHPGRKQDECAACHDDPHGGQFEGARCLTCHAPTAFVPHRFDLARHASTGFALENSHAAVACEACHSKPAPDASRAFHGTSSACSSCHADAHDGFFARAAAPKRASNAPDCADCHSTSTFADERARGFDHVAWTGFALLGEHDAAACEACHRPRVRADERGRTFGVIERTLDRPATACATCHFDAHGGFFDGAAHEPADCAACHTPHGFEFAAENFDHARLARFELSGAHARAKCESCHGASHSADARVRAVLGRGKGSFDDCRTCHADPHGGSFDQGSTRSACTDCHTTESFEAARTSFDHGERTGFALDGAHSTVACQSCHPQLASPESNGRAFARARGTNCADCHEDPHVGQFARGGATNCSSCHTPASTFDALVFDHARDSRFQLDATHAKLDCAACHRPAMLSGGGSAIRYKPLGTTCGDCHAARGARDEFR